MKAAGIILAAGNNKRMRGLSDRRAVCALPVAGSFRAIDFALSNMANSRVHTVAVLTQYNTRSLHEHLNSAKWWHLGRKQGGLRIFSPTITPDHKGWYRGTADAMYQNIEYLKGLHEPYVVITNGDIICKVDYNEMLRHHNEKQADITILCKDMPKDADLTRYGVVMLDHNSRVVSFEEKPMEPKSQTINAGVYLLRRRLLIELLEHAAEENRMDFVNDILYRYRNRLHISGYMLDGYWRNVADAQDYYHTNMDFLKSEVRRHFFVYDPPIYSKSHDLPPAKFNPGSQISASLFSSGCIINGKVENSVLSREVFIGKNCLIHNSVLLPGAYICDGAVIENCIVESGSVVKPNTVHRGTSDRVEVVYEPGNRYTAQGNASLN